MSFSEFVTQHETTIRLSSFFGILLLMASWEIAAPRRTLTISKTLRWLNNLGIVVLNTAIVRLIFPIAAVGVATFAAQQGWGLLNYYTLTPLLAILISIVAMDFVIYCQHVLVHAIPLLWRLHRVHHADLDYDVTTGSRFHPIEIIFSLLIKMATIIVLGPPIIAVILFEVILNGMAMFNHANVGLPKSLDNLLRWIVVTPDMHRVHHSVEDDEANSNFGFNLSIWDRLLGTYRDQPRGGHTEMIIGIHTFREPKQVARLDGMLTLPFLGKMSGYVINRRHWNNDNTKE